MVDQPNPPEPPVRLSAKAARGGEIILRSRSRRVIFLAGLIGMVMLGLIMAFALR